MRCKVYPRMVKRVPMIFSPTLQVVAIGFVVLAVNCLTPSSFAAELDVSDASDAKASSPPNVLLIAIDDLKDWVGCLGGHPHALTPNHDRLAKRGMLFCKAQYKARYKAQCQTQYQAQYQAPFCAPPGASLLSGRYPHTADNTPYDWRYAVQTTFARNSHAFRSKTHRFIRNENEKEELYDHRVDPNAWNNLIRADARPEQAALLNPFRDLLPERNAPYHPSTSTAPIHPWLKQHLTSEGVIKP